MWFVFPPLSVFFCDFELYFLFISICSIFFIVVIWLNVEIWPKIAMFWYHYYDWFFFYKNKNEKNFHLFLIHYYFRSIMLVVHHGKHRFREQNVGFLNHHLNVIPNVQIWQSMLDREISVSIFYIWKNLNQLWNNERLKIIVYSESICMFWISKKEILFHVHNNYCWRFSNFSNQFLIVFILDLHSRIRHECMVS